MSLIGTYSITGVTQSLSHRWDNIDNLLVQLLDNAANEIGANDIRDSVYTLWKRIDDVQIMASQSASASTYYSNSTPVPVTIGGISAGVTFSNASMSDMFNQLLYPYIAPSASLSITTTSYQYGGPTSFVFSWSVTAHTNPVSPIIVNGNVKAVPVPPNPSSGSQALTGTHSLTPGISQTNVFGMVYGDSVTSVTYSTTATITWMNKRYWGYINLSSLGNPNLTTNPGSSSLVGSYITDAMVNSGVNGASANGDSILNPNSGRELSITKNKTYTGINGAGNHLLFAFPTSFGTPAFSVNGLPNTAFTKVRSNLAFTNETGFSGTNYDVWVSNTLQNSPLNIIIS